MSPRMSNIGILLELNGIDVMYDLLLLWGEKKHQTKEGNMKKNKRDVSPIIAANINTASVDHKRYR